MKNIIYRLKWPIILVSVGVLTVNPAIGTAMLFGFGLWTWIDHYRDTRRSPINPNRVVAGLFLAAICGFMVLRQVDAWKQAEYDAPMIQAMNDKSAPTVCPEYFKLNFWQKHIDPAQSAGWCESYPQYDGRAVSSAEKPSSETTSALWK
ncbi:hypothetical protein ELG97_37200 [Rhizobium leguminosarum]|uniref:hypothetical protein n=1 Tax=Rhizobium leguminosarum TaxID=384 RepID=UPI00102FCEE0|nr:hypothetical protein [Rhizobium leguminosarum]TBE73869.1 hypothetical protein ELG97_37200 [Rhizobium leguminosarum]